MFVIYYAGFILLSKCAYGNIDYNSKPYQNLYHQNEMFQGKRTVERLNVIDPKSHTLKPATFRTMSNSELAFGQQYRRTHPIRIVVVINNVSIGAIVDTGAGHSIMSQKVADRVFLKLPQLGNDGKTTGATGSGVDLLGPLFAYATTPFGRSMLRLTILPGFNYDLALGMDFLAHPSIKAKIDFEKMTLTIGNVTMNVTENISTAPYPNLDANTIVNDWLVK